MKNILIPIDGSEYGDKAVEKGKEIAKAFGSNVVLMNIMTVNFPVYAQEYGQAPIEDINQVYEDARKISEELLLSAKKSFGDMADKVSTVSLQGDVANTIVDYVKSNDVDLVIMGSHGLGAVMNRLLTGSVTTRVLHHIQKPVLVVK